MEGSFSEGNRSRTFLVGLGVLGLTFFISLGYSQLSYDSYAQASSRATQLQNRLDNFLVVRGRINSVVEAVSDKDIQFANPSLAIDQRVWNLQTAWSDFRDDQRPVAAGARFLTPAPSELDSSIDQFALAALRNALALRRGNSGPEFQINASLASQLSAMENEVTKAIQTSEAKKENAVTGIRYGRSVATGSFFALSLLIASGLLVSGMGSLREWIGPLSADKLASPER